MNQRIRTLSVALGMCLFGSSLQAADLYPAIAPVQGHYIVVLKDDAARLNGEDAKHPTVAHVARSLANRIRGMQVLTAYEHVLRGFAVRADDDALAKLMADARVAYVQEDGMVSAPSSEHNAAKVSGPDLQRRPAGDMHPPVATSGRGVHAYIVDTGILGSHTEFNARIANGFSVIDDGKGTRDCHGQGTHVAGTVGGATRGVAKGVTVHPVRVLGCTGSGSLSGLISGMDWVATHHVKPAVANIGVGGSLSRATDAAVAGLLEAGVTVTLPAATGTASACPLAPASAARAISVGATTDAHAPQPKGDRCVALFAPGANISSAWSSHANASRTLSGAWAASAHVAGDAALYLASHPGASPEQVKTALMASSQHDALVGTGPNDDGTVFIVDQDAPLTELAGPAGSQILGTFGAPGAIKRITVMLKDSKGEPDLYVKYGQAPTTTDFDCHAQSNGHTRICRLDNPQAGDWYIMVRGTTDYSGATLVVRYH